MVFRQNLEGGIKQILTNVEIKMVIFFEGFPKLSVRCQDTIALHCGPRGSDRRSQLYEHLFCMFWASYYLTSVQLAATTWSGQIWTSGLILPHFDVGTIFVA